MSVAIGERCPACGEPLVRLGCEVDVCMFHDGVQDREVQQGLPRARTPQDKAYDLFVKGKWERETGTHWSDMRVRRKR